MDKNFCKIIDDDNLVEKYVSGDLHGEILNQFTEHIKECETHSKAVTLERALKRGVRDFARSEIKSNLRGQIKKQEISKYYILRYAAILIVAIMAPIILYYQFGKHQVHTEIAEEFKKVPTQSVPDRAMSKADDEPPVGKTEALSKGIKTTAAGSVSDIDLTKPETKINAKTESMEEVDVDIDLPAAAPVSAQKSVRGRITRLTSQDEIYIYPEESAHKDSIYTYIKIQEDVLIKCISDATNKNNHIIIEFSVSTKGIPGKITVESEGLIEEETKACIINKIKSWHLPGIKDEIVIRKKIEIGGFDSQPPR